jgi:hypothetical protein
MSGRCQQLIDQGFPQETKNRQRGDRKTTGRMTFVDSTWMGVWRCVRAGIVEIFGGYWL